jgi:hypothetical protein
MTKQNKEIHWRFGKITVSVFSIEDLSRASRREIRRSFGGIYCLHLQCRRLSQATNKKEAESSPALALNWPHGVLFHKIELFVTTAVRTSNPASESCDSSFSRLNYRLTAYLLSLYWYSTSSLNIALKMATEKCAETVENLQHPTRCIP